MAVIPEKIIVRKNCRRGFSEKLKSDAALHRAIPGMQPNLIMRVVSRPFIIEPGRMGDLETHRGL